jgi:hypothetical protein
MRDVDQDNLVDDLGVPRGTGQPTGRENPIGEPAADESRATGDDNPHDCSLSE